MEEPVGGENFGRAASTDPEAEGRLQPLDVAGMKTLDLLEEGGFSVVDTMHGRGTGKTYGARDMGMTAHRGVLHPDEYVDTEALQAAVTDVLGYTYEQVAFAYKNGRPTAEQSQLRERIDSRLLALSRSGGNMAALARVLPISEKAIDRVLARARRAEVRPIVVNPAVRTRTVCFKCEAEGARPRKRRHSTSPEQWVGTVDLCDKCYGEGFETKPGNPRYWEHRLATRPIEPQGLKPTP